MLSQVISLPNALKWPLIFLNKSQSTYNDPQGPTKPTLAPLYLFFSPCLLCFRKSGLIAMPGTFQNVPILGCVYWLSPLSGIHFPWTSAWSIPQTPLRFAYISSFQWAHSGCSVKNDNPSPLRSVTTFPLLKTLTWIFVPFFIYLSASNKIYTLIFYHVEFIFCLLSL